MLGNSSTGSVQLIGTEALTDSVPETETVTSVFDGISVSSIAAEGLFQAHSFAHASLMTIGRPAATPRGPPLRFLCLVVALEHANEISCFSLKTEGVHIGRPRPSSATPGGSNLPNGTKTFDDLAATSAKYSAF